jgi:hypothetical protein
MPVRVGGAMFAGPGFDAPAPRPAPQPAPASPPKEA